LGLETDSTADSDASYLHSRDVSVLLLLLWLRRHAGVLIGLDSDAISESRRPTRPTARWVFYFAAIHDVS
jgi:hypothetical protein